MHHIDVASVRVEILPAQDITREQWERHIGPLRHKVIDAPRGWEFDSPSLDYDLRESTYIVLLL